MVMRGKLKSSSKMSAGLLALRLIALNLIVYRGLKTILTGLREGITLRIGKMSLLSGGGQEAGGLYF
jgi:hypothetical protein